MPAKGGNPGSSVPLQFMDDVAERVLSKFPRLKASPSPFAVIDRRGQVGRGAGALEFYHPKELYNPLPGKATIAVFDKGLDGDMLDKAVFGDMLHFLPEFDQKFAALRNEFANTITREQLEVDRRAYDRARRERGEDRPFADWFRQSRLDAYIRGFLAPDKDNDWADAYTPSQRGLLGLMKSHIEGGD